MFPALAHFDYSAESSIAHHDGKPLSSLDIFGGRFRVIPKEWTVAPRAIGRPTYALLRVEDNSDMTPKIFLHI